MPGKRSGAASAAGGTAEAAPKPTAAVVWEPPATNRTRKSTAAPELIADTAEKALAGWAGDGIMYDTKDLAGNAAVVLRRAVIRYLGGNPNVKKKDQGYPDPVAKRIHAQAWEILTTNGKPDGDPAPAGKGGRPTGKWVFALHIDPEDAPEAEAATG